MKATNAFPLLLALMAALLSVPQPVYSDSCAPAYGGAAASNIDVIRITIGSGVSTSHVVDAYQSWNNTCQSGTTLPAFTTVGSGDITIPIEYYEDTNCPLQNCGCGLFDPGPNAVGGTIRLYEFDSHGLTCFGHYEDTLRHEFGHALRLGDAPGCSNRIMGNSRKPVKTSDCAAANQRWLTPIELQWGDDGLGDHPCEE